MTKNERKRFPVVDREVVSAASMAVASNPNTVPKDSLINEFGILHLGSGIVVTIPDMGKPISRVKGRELEEVIGLDLEEFAGKDQFADRLNLLRETKFFNQRDEKSSEYIGEERRGIDADMAMSQVIEIVAENATISTTSGIDAEATANIVNDDKPEVLSSEAQSRGDRKKGLAQDTVKAAAGQYIRSIKNR